MPDASYCGRSVVTLPFPMESLAPGDRVRVRGWLSAPRAPTATRRFDERSYWAAQRAYTLCRVWSADSVERLASTLSLARLGWWFHQRFKTFWYRHLPADEAALLCSMAIGSRGILPETIKDACRRAGIYHILVVSGQQVSLLIVIGLFGLRSAGLPPRWLLAVCAGPLLFYNAVVGGDPPVLRATVMALVMLLVTALGRDVPRYTALWWAGLVMLALEPGALFGASFQLSFGATASLLVFMPMWESLTAGIRRPWRWVVGAIGMSTAVYLGIGPLLLYYFHQFSLIGLGANWTLFPLAGAVMVGGLCVGTVGVLWPGELPPALFQVIHWGLGKTLAWILWLGGRSWAALPVPPPPLAAMVLYYVLLFIVTFKVEWWLRDLHEQIRNPLQKSRSRL